MRYNVLINSKNNAGGDNSSNYKYNFDFSNFQEGEYELGFNFNTNPLKTVQATPIPTGDTTFATFSTNTLNITNTPLNYEYTLTNGTPYEVISSSVRSPSFPAFNALNNTGANWWGSAGYSYDTSGIQIKNEVSIVDNINRYGEWLQIKLPYSLNLKSFVIQHIFRSEWGKVKDFILVGSNDTSAIKNWNTIIETSITSFNLNQQIPFTVENNTFYSYFRIIVKTIVVGDVILSPNDLPYAVTIPIIRLYGETAPVNNASLLQIEIENLGATKQAYTTTDLTASKSSNVIGTIPLSKELFYNSSYKFNNSVKIMSKPQSSEITIKLKDSAGELFNIDTDYLMLLSFLKK